MFGTRTPHHNCQLQATKLEGIATTKAKKYTPRLVLMTGRLLLFAELKSLASLENQLALDLALLALKAEHDLLRRLSLKEC